MYRALDAVTVRQLSICRAAIANSGSDSLHKRAFPSRSLCGPPGRRTSRLSDFVDAPIRRRFG